MDMRVQFATGTMTRTSSRSRTGPGLAAWFCGLGLSISSFQLTAWLAPYSFVSSQLAFCCGFGAVAASAIGVSAATPTSRRTCGAASLGAALAWFGVTFVGADTFRGAAILAVLLAAGTAIGAWVGAGVEQPGYLLFVAIVSSIADLWSVGDPAGPSAQLVQHRETLELFALPWPMLGTREVASLLGVGDVVFTSLYWSAARRHGLSLRRTFVALAGAYVVTALVVVVAARPIPVLPLLGIAIVIAHPAARRPYGQQARRAAWLVAACIVGVTYWVVQRTQ